jgi:hypothetical protein
MRKPKEFSLGTLRTSADGHSVIDNFLVREGAVPEPSAAVLLVIGFAMIPHIARRRRHSLCKSVPIL